MTLQNLELKGKKVRFNWVKPFGKIANLASRQAWLALLNQVRTFFIDQIITPIQPEKIDKRFVIDYFRRPVLALNVQ